MLTLGFKGLKFYRYTGTCLLGSISIHGCLDQKVILPTMRWGESLSNQDTH